MSEKFVSIIDRCLDTVPQEATLTLPKLKKVNAGKKDVPIIKLPKLTKVTT